MDNLFYFLDEIFNEYEIVDMYNEYADFISWERINNIEDIDSNLQGFSASEVANMVAYGDYNANDSYYILDGYGNIQTIDEHDIVEYIESQVDNEEFYTFLIENNYFTKKEYKYYLKKYLNN